MHLKMNANILVILHSELTVHILNMIWIIRKLDEGKWALSNKLLTLRPIDATYALDLNVLEISNSKLVLEYMEKEDDGG